MLTEQEHLKKYATKLAPAGCSFKVGDRVTYTNVYGASFEGKQITGFAKIPSGDRFIYLEKDSYWFPVSVKTLELGVSA